MSKETMATKESTATTEEDKTVATKTTTATTANAESTKAVEEKKTVVYIGPTIPGVVAANTTFNNGLTETVKNATAETPAINTLIVPIDKLVQARVQLRQKNSVYDVCYNKVQQYIDKKGE